MLRLIDENRKQATIDVIIVTPDFMLGQKSFRKGIKILRRGQSAHSQITFDEFDLCVRMIKKIIDEILRIQFREILLDTLLVIVISDLDGFNLAEGKPCGSLDSFKQVENPGFPITFGTYFLQFTIIAGFIPDKIPA